MDNAINRVGRAGGGRAGPCASGSVALARGRRCGSGLLSVSASARRDRSHRGDGGCWADLVCIAAGLALAGNRRRYGRAVDRARIVLPDDLAAGRYDLVVGWYDWQTGARLALRNHNGEEYVLGSVTIDLDAAPQPDLACQMLPESCIALE